MIIPVNCRWHKHLLMLEMLYKGILHFATARKTMPDNEHFQQTAERIQTKIILN